MEKVKNNDDFRQRVIEELNLVRTNPQEYADKIRKYAKYFKGKILRIPEIIPIMTQEGAKAYEEAAFYLDNLTALPALKYCSGLTHAAHDALMDIQELEDVDSLNDLNIDKYLEKHGEVVGHFAQAVDFGSSLPELVVINLLVDDGDSNRGNRMNISDSKYKLVGVSTGSHTVYHNCTVLMYARHFYPPSEVPGDLSDGNYEEAKTEKRKSGVRKSLHHEEGEKTLEGSEESLMRQLINIKLKEKSEESAKKEPVHPVNHGDDDFDLPEGVLKIERQEKVVVENGNKRKIVKLTKHMEDGSIETEIFKEKI